MNMRIFSRLIVTSIQLAFLFGVVLFSSCGQRNSKTEDGAMHLSKPNIILIMCDDMGFSDLGCYGGEIHTPNIDALAEEGIRFTRFKNCGRCCPSRTALLTGRNQHAVGMGWMTAVDEHRPGYRGQLSSDVPTIAEIFKANNYSTYLSGKWHVTLKGAHDSKDSKPNGSWPVERGFDQSYGGLAGGGGYYKVSSLIRNTTHLDTFPKGYYYTHAITQNAVHFIEEHDARKPLFLYLAHYAPHRPLEAPRERVEACRERYLVGYDILRAERYRRLKEKGIVSTNVPLPVHEREYGNNRPSWKSLSEKKKQRWIEEMSTYAAMIEIVDDGIGEVVEATKRKGIYENTIFLFLSDNGATNEGGDISQLGADLSNTPFRSYKAFAYMGGVSSPLIVHFPQDFSKANGTISRELAHITDILPTCLDLAGITYPESFKGAPIPPSDGRSLVPALNGVALPTRDLFFEHQSSCAVISGKWKLVRAHISKPWELINLKEDPFEQHDVSNHFPDKVAELDNRWKLWAEMNQVLPLELREWKERIRYYESLNPDQDGID